MHADVSEQDEILALTAGQRRLAYAVVLTAAVAGTLIFSALQPLLPAMGQAFGGGSKGELSAQMAMMMPSLGYLISGGLSGWIIGRLGLRLSIVVALATIGLFGAAAGVIGGIVPLAITRFFVGAGGALVTSACMALLASLYDTKQRAKMVGYFTAVTTGGTLPCSFLSGLIAQSFGWRASFSLFLLFGVIGVALALAGVPAQPESTSRGPVRKASESGGGLTGLLPILFVIFLLQVPTIMPVAQFPFVLAELGVHDPRMLSIIMGGAALVMSFSAILSGYGQARFGAWPVVLLGLFGVAIGYAGVGFASSWQIAAFANLIGLLGSALYLPQFYTLPIAHVPPAARARAVGLAQSAMFLSAAANPFILAPFRSAFGLKGMYLAVGAIALAGCIIGALMIRRRDRAVPAKVTEAA